MTPTLLGRLQTRILVTAIVGGLWTLIVTPVLPSGAGGMFGMTFRLLGLVILLGSGWELVYHGIQQFRWEKDWPTGFGLVTALNEGFALWWFAAAWGPSVPGPAFAVHFATTWIVVWAVVNGPVRVVAPRWRFRGGRFI